MNVINFIWVMRKVLMNGEILRVVKNGMTAAFTAGKQNPLSYERVWSVSVGANGWRKKNVNLSDGYYLFVEHNEPYSHLGIESKKLQDVSVNAFVFIGPFPDSAAVKEYEKISKSAAKTLVWKK